MAYAHLRRRIDCPMCRDELGMRRKDNSGKPIKNCPTCKRVEIVKYKLVKVWFPGRVRARMVAHA